MDQTDLGQRSSSGFQDAYHATLVDQRNNQGEDEDEDEEEGKSNKESRSNAELKHLNATGNKDRGQPNQRESERASETDREEEQQKNDRPNRPRTSVSARSRREWMMKQDASFHFSFLRERESPSLQQRHAPEQPGRTGTAKEETEGELGAASGRGPGPGHHRIEEGHPFCSACGPSSLMSSQL
ncbi:hypothetical protein TESG_08668 [Trichophyton tonsurans CBS 112818]|uniref:Uncharacterized protein n=1 Tax=Trichophyton tonsurans (strain CBS 112818) TaxID=647933 RepID=F2SAU5_TRIT1|nr:hypothetical protein TESG_08668 [Trichophyton tonsurans CBS 112818]